jgi:hypothetical protein
MPWSEGELAELLLLEKGHELKRGIISDGSFKQSSSHCHLHQAACLPPEWYGLEDGGKQFE